MKASLAAPLLITTYIQFAGGGAVGPAVTWPETLFHVAQGDQELTGIFLTPLEAVPAYAPPGFVTFVVMRRNPSGASTVVTFLSGGGLAACEKVRIGEPAVTHLAAGDVLTFAILSTGADVSLPNLAISAEYLPA